MISLIAAATISMLAPTLNEDGTPLVDLDQICLYETGTVDPVECRTFSTPGAALSFTRSVNLLLERKCFNATAIDESGNESIHSGTACTTRWRCYTCHSNEEI